MFPTMIIVDPANYRVVTRFGREAVDAEKLSGSAMTAWKGGLSGFFPEFLERKRSLYFSPIGFLLWSVAIYIILHFYYGFTITGFVFGTIKWFFYTFIDPTNNPDGARASTVTAVKTVVTATRYLRG
jgi:hypothetical protein